MTGIGTMSGIFACKSVESLIAESEGSDSEGVLPRTLGFFSLTCFGVGSTIGAGIFVLTGTVAAAHAGPAVVLSFVLAGLACALAGLCYAEFAAMIYKTLLETLKKGRPPPQEQIRSVIALLVVALLLGLFVFGCAWLIFQLIDYDRMSRCFESGRRDCAWSIPGSSDDSL